MQRQFLKLKLSWTQSTHEGSAQPAAGGASQPTAGGAAGLTYMSKSGRTEQFTPVSSEQNEEVIKDYVSDCGDKISAYK